MTSRSIFTTAGAQTHIYTAYISSLPFEYIYICTYLLVQVLYKMFANRSSASSRLLIHVLNCLFAYTYTIELSLLLHLFLKHVQIVEDLRLKGDNRVSAYLSQSRRVAYLLHFSNASACTQVGSPYSLDLSLKSFFFFFE